MQTAMGTMAQYCVMRESIARERFVALGMRIGGQSAAASQILDLPATPPPSLAAGQKSEIFRSVGHATTIASSSIRCR